MKNHFSIRRFQGGDAEAVRQIIHRGLREVNSRDYSPETIEAYCRHFSLKKILEQAESGHMYVAESADGTILGTGTIAPYWGSERESILLTLYVRPDLLRRGIGSALITALEKDNYFLRAFRIEIPSSISAEAFYEKMGYSRKYNQPEPDPEGLIRMEKIRALKNIDVCLCRPVWSQIDSGSDPFQG